MHHVPINPEPQRGVQCPQRQETSCEVLDRFDLHEVRNEISSVADLRGRIQHASRCALEGEGRRQDDGGSCMEIVLSAAFLNASATAGPGSKPTLAKPTLAKIKV